MNYIQRKKEPLEVCIITIYKSYDHDQANLYENTPADVRQYILQSIESFGILNNDLCEKYLLLFYYDINTWTAVTNTRVLWSYNGATSDIRHCDIIDSSIIPFDRIANDRLSMLYVITKNNEIHCLPIECGVKLECMHNVFLEIPSYFCHEKDEIEKCRHVLIERMNHERELYRKQYLESRK